MYKPLNDKVLVKVDPAETKVGSIIIPDKSQDRPQTGTVEAVGPGKYYKGERIPINVKVGDKVIYGQFGPTALDEGAYVILKEEEILAALED